MRKILALIAGFLLTISSVYAQDATPTAAPQPVGPLTFFYTYTQASGNRFIEGRGSFPNVPGYDVKLGTSPAWVVGGYIDGDFPRWHIRDAIGSMFQVVRPVDSKVPGVLQSDTTSTPATALPVLAVAQGVSGNLKSQDNPTSVTHPVPLRDGSIFLQVTYNGDVAIWRNDIELARLPLNALRDARPVINKDGLVALYIGASNQRYVHGILGDNFEGVSLVVLALTDTQFGIRARVDLQGEDVFEGMSPFWADINGDGSEDLVTTVSNSTGGSKIRVYLFNGTEFTGEVNGPDAGQGSRWRHQLAWGAFGPEGENELVAVLTPEVNGTVEFYRYNAEAQSLDIVVQQSGYSSHVIGTINLDMAVGGDFNGDGQPEIVLPSQDRTRIVGLQHTTEGVREMWSLPVNGTLITNLCAVATPDGALSLAYGTDDGRLRLWLPDDVADTDTGE
jgi:hypothetical protein